MATTRHALTTQILTRLGDLASLVWTRDQVEIYTETGYAALAQALGVFVDWTYAENLARGFSYTATWEQTYDHVAFDYGMANYTYADERRLLTESARVGPGNHTSPFEVTDGHLSAASADTSIPATVDLPATITRITRMTWDRRTCAALVPAQLARTDRRYETTTGPVVGYLWRKDGIRTLRKYKVPAQQATTYTVDGSWGVLRDPDDLDGGTITGDTWPQMFSYTQPFEAGAAGYYDVGRATFTASWESGLLADDLGPANHTADFEYDLMIRAGLTPTTVEASWGLARRIEDQHPMGDAEGWGSPRRVYHDGMNVRLEHGRVGRAVARSTDTYELPDRYVSYLRDFAMSQCLALECAGQDRRLAQHYAARWQRGLARIARRLRAQDAERVNRFGGSTVRQGVARPQYPPQYGSVVR